MSIARINRIRKVKLFLYKKIYIKLPTTFRILAVQIYNTLVLKLARPYGYSHFPLKEDGSSYFYTPLLEKDGRRKYFTGFYHEQSVSNYIVNPTDLLNYKTEIVSGEMCSGRSVHRLAIERESLLPFLIVNKKVSNEQSDKYSLNIRINNQKYFFENLSQNRFHYFPIKEKSEIALRSDYDFVLGNPIELKQRKRHKKKLVLNLFVDGLAAEIFRTESLQELMPNSYKFFKDSFITLNGNTNSDWTDPSVPSIFSGLYPINHRVFDETGPKVGHDYKIMSDFFQEEGYITAQICSNYGKTPSGGYVKGFDRTIYKRSMSVDLIVSAFLEHMRTFQGRDNFVWLSILDLHHFLDIVPSIDTQSLVELQHHDYRDVKTKSVVGAFNTNRTKRFAAELKRIDFFLKIIFDYILQNYKNDEFVVSLCSDHGQPYITHEKELFSRQRTSVPFMLRSAEISAGIVDKRIDNIDILPAILSLSDIGCENCSFDGEVPRILGGHRDRDYSFSESIFIGKPYTVAIVDTNHRFYFEAKNCVDKDGFFVLEEYKAVLKNSMSGVDETELYREKVSRYVTKIFDHVFSSKYASQYIKRKNESER